MSRIGKKPIDIPSGVTVSVDGQRVVVKGPLGELSLEMPGALSAKVDGAVLQIERPDDSRQSRSFHGLTRSLAANMVDGVSKGFRKELEIEGVGFKGSVQGGKMVLSLGFSSPVEYEFPKGVKVEEQGGTKITVSGPDKQKVGQAAARIRAFAPAEPYKGKGVRYKGEHVRRKVGKTVA